MQVETLQVIVGSYGQNAYLEETIKSSQHEFYANASLSPTVLCRKHNISRIKVNTWQTLTFCEIKFDHKNIPTP